MAMLHREDDLTKWVGVRPGHYGEQIAKYQSAQATTTTLYSVTASKTLFLTHLTVGYYAASAGHVIEVGTKHFGGADFYKFVSGTIRAIGQGCFPLLWNPPLEIAATDYIYLYSSHIDLIISVFGHGWEQ